MALPTLDGWAMRRAFRFLSTRLIFGGAHGAPIKLLSSRSGSHALVTTRRECKNVDPTDGRRLHSHRSRENAKNFKTLVPPPFVTVCSLKLFRGLLLSPIDASPPFFAFGIQMIPSPASYQISARTSLLHSIPELHQHQLPTRMLPTTSFPSGPHSVLAAQP